jgi:TonB family protein
VKVKVLCNSGGKPYLLRSSQVQRLITRRTSIKPPGSLEKNNLRGTVTVNILIDEKGKVICIKAVKGHPIAQSSVVASIYNWKFKPYKFKGKPISVFGVLTVSYDFRK